MGGDLRLLSHTRKITGSHRLATRSQAEKEHSMIDTRTVQTALNELHALTIDRGADRFDPMSLDFHPNAEPRVYMAFMPVSDRFHRGANALQAIGIAKQAVLNLPSKEQRQRLALRAKMAELVEEIRASELDLGEIDAFANPLLAMMDKLSANILPHHPAGTDEDYDPITSPEAAE